MTIKRSPLTNVQKSTLHTLKHYLLLKHSQLKHHYSNKPLQHHADATHAQVDWPRHRTLP